MIWCHHRKIRRMILNIQESSGTKRLSIINRVHLLGGGAGIGKHTAIQWMLMSFQNSYVEILTPQVMVLGGGAFGRSLGHEGGGFMTGIRTFIKGAPESFLIPSVTGHSEKTAFCEPGNESSSDTEPVSTLSLNFPACRLWHINVCCLSHLVNGILL